MHHSGRSLAARDSGSRWLRFSNGIADTGAGPWALRPEPPPSTANGVVSAVQEIRTSGAYRCGTQPKQVSECYSVAPATVTGTYVFHPTHNHWHLGSVALFEVRKAARRGRTPATRAFSAGWVDQYRPGMCGEVRANR